MARTLLTRNPNSLGMSVLGALPFLYPTKNGLETAWSVPDAHGAAHCREGRNCSGPGCRIDTQKR